MEDTEDMQYVNDNTGTEQVEIQAVIFPPYQTLAPGFDFVLDPPGSLFDMSGQMPKISLSRIKYVCDVEVRFIGSNQPIWGQPAAINDITTSPVSCPEDIVKMYVKYIFDRKTAISNQRVFGSSSFWSTSLPPSLSSAAFVAPTTRVQNDKDWSDDIQIEQKNVDAFAAWVDVQCSVLGVGFR